MILPHQITCIPNPNAATIYGHAPYLDKLIFKYYGDSAPMIPGASRAGEIDRLAGPEATRMSRSSPDIPDNPKKIQDRLFNEGNYFNSLSASGKFGDDYKAIIQSDHADDRHPG